MCLLKKKNENKIWENAVYSLVKIWATGARIERLDTYW